MQPAFNTKLNICVVLTERIQRRTLTTTSGLTNYVDAVPYHAWAAAGAVVRR